MTNIRVLTPRRLLKGEQPAGSFAPSPSLLHCPNGFIFHGFLCTLKWQALCGSLSWIGPFLRNTSREQLLSSKRVLIISYWLIICGELIGKFLCFVFWCCNTATFWLVLRLWEIATEHTFRIFVVFKLSVHYLMRIWGEHISMVYL